MVKQNSLNDGSEAFEVSIAELDWMSDQTKTQADSEEYEKRSQVLVDQYSAFGPLPDTSVDGELTLGENIRCRIESQTPQIDLFGTSVN